MATNRIPIEPEEELIVLESPLRKWLKSHRTSIFIVTGILLVLLMFLGIRWYNSRNNPISRMMSASAKNFGTSFRYELRTVNGKEDVMFYSGEFSSDPGSHTLRARYDAQYPDYSYTNVVYTDGNAAVKGNLYQKKWTITDCSEDIQDYFDFYDDYRRGDFDSASFLRFTDLTGEYNAGELDRFVDILSAKLVSDQSMATVKTTQEGNSTVCTITIDPQAFFDLILDKGASVFFRSTDYDEFCMRYDLARDEMDGACCTLTYSVNREGYMSSISFMIDTGSDRYAVSCSMSDFGSTEVTIPESFYTAAQIAPPDEP